jgi:phosphatidylglycerol:prolipoprotein diacylglycerol transferase
MLAHWKHDLNPFIIQFSENFGIRWYGMAYVLGILLGGWLIMRWQRQGRVPLTRGEVLDFVMVAAIGMLVGGRLGFFVFYQWPQFVREPWVVFYLPRGGMASHGGLLGLALATWIYARLKGRSWLVLVDTLAVVTPIGVIAGRIANFINGELWGRPTEMPWGVIFPNTPEVGGVIVARHPSQLYAAFLEGVVVLAVLLWVHQRHRRPGLTLGIGLAVYGIARFVDEFWREPNAGYDLYFGWMTKGQALTIPLLLAAACLIVYALRRPPQPDAYRPKSADPGPRGGEEA